MATTTAALETTQKRLSKLWWSVPLLLVLLLAAQLYLSAYQPIGLGNTWTTPRGPGTSTMGTYPEPEGLSYPRLVVGEPMTFAFSLVNDGPLPIELEEVTHPRLLGLRPQTVRITSADYNTQPDAPWKIFVPTSLGVGEQRIVQLTYRTESCEFDGGLRSSVDSVNVGFSSLWHTKETPFPLPFRVVLGGPQGSCS